MLVRLALLKLKEHQIIKISVRE
jgi:hypothetical protein